LIEKYNRKLKQKLIPKGPKKPVRFLEIYLGGVVGDWVEKKMMNYQKRRILAGRTAYDEIVATEKEIRLHPKKWVKVS
jgi:hypothetical protein